MLDLTKQREIRFATCDDVSGVLAILEQNLLTNKNIENNLLEKQGFLVKSFTGDELKTGISDYKNQMVLVAIEEKEVVGYAWSYDLQTKKPHWVSDINFTSDVSHIINSEKILYHRHIAKKLNTKGIGKQLLFRLIIEAKKRKYHYILCQIVQKPFKNIASTILHEQFGFMPVGFLIENEFTLGIYLKKLI